MVSGGVSSVDTRVFQPAACMRVAVSLVSSCNNVRVNKALSTVLPVPNCPALSEPYYHVSSEANVLARLALRTVSSDVNAFVGQHHCMGSTTSDI